MALKQHLIQKLEQRLSPQQIQLMKLLQIPTIELEQRVKQELEDNPALEEGMDDYGDEFSNDLDDEFDKIEVEEEYDSELGDDDFEFDISEYIDEEGSDYKTSVNNRSKDEEERVVPLTGEKSFQEQLTEQLHLLYLDDERFVIAITIIGNLDESGYLTREITSIVDDLAFSSNMEITEEEVEKVLYIIQELDPAGVGARNLQECLLIQMKRKQDGNITRYTAKIILEEFFEEFTRKHYDKIARRLEIEDDDLKDALDEILKLNPKPGGSMIDSAKNHQQIIPDFMIMEQDGRLELTINGRNTPELKVSREYEKMLRNYSEGAKTSKSDREAVLFVKQKLDGAKWFIDAVKQRQHTLMYTMEAIMNYQYEYFLTGDETKLRPMILRDIAELIDLDVSTVSRVANSKYVHTDSGIFPLKYFFSESLSTDSGEEVSTREVKQILFDAVDNENKKRPLTDEQLAELLNEKGYNIARRTVAKYREQLNISVARLRKEL